MENSKLKVVGVGCIHGHLVDYTKIPASDVCCILGDISPVVDHSVKYQEQWFKDKFIPWIADIPASRVLVGEGNHDFWGQSQTQEQIQTLMPNKCFYLRDTAIEINGLTFFYTPWVSNCPRWSFNKEEEYLEPYLDAQISALGKKIDVFLSHAPPRIGGIGKCFDVGKVYTLDPRTGLYNKEVLDIGNQAIANIINKYPSRLALSSHAHSGDHKGSYTNGGATFLCNCAYLGEDYKPKYPVRQFLV